MTSTNIPQSNSTVTGDLRKMKVDAGIPVRYALRVGEQQIPLNALVGTDIAFTFTGQIHCIYCSRSIKKTYHQGYCFPCFKRLARCDMCILKPELCHFHKGTCREEDWGRENCMQPHLVYLANSSGLKVGITRLKNVPTRWIDQGASQALPIIRVASRLQSGLIESALREHLTDRTNWRAMLKGDPPKRDLEARRDELIPVITQILQSLSARFDAAEMQVLDDTQTVSFQYPILTYPDKITSINADKNPEVRGRLMGIKGQYLILSTGVINMRKYGGYEIAWHPSKTA